MFAIKVLQRLCCNPKYINSIALKPFKQPIKPTQFYHNDYANANNNVLTYKTKATYADIFSLKRPTI